MRFAILNAAMLATTALLTAVNLSSPVATADEKKSDTITARRIVLLDEKGNQRVTLLASEGASGIWVTDGSGRGASIYTARPDQGPTIALMNESNIGKGWPLAFSLDSQGKPFVQVIDGEFSSFPAKGLVPKN